MNVARTSFRVSHDQPLRPWQARTSPGTPNPTPINVRLTERPIGRNLGGSPREVERRRELRHSVSIALRLFHYRYRAVSF